MKKLKFFLYGAFVILITNLPAWAGHYQGGGSKSILMLLVALAIGYWVLTLSDKQKKPLDLVGRIIGGLILLVAIGGLLCSAFFGYCRWKSGCQVGKSATYHSWGKNANPKSDSDSSQK